ncbi:motility-associated protein Scm1 [Spiroplasma chinense]|uniref:Motility-associated protein Scm1 n=1 Tax=Spiroplasma chinense TaxID=216932 RepID=A0A5B9Y3T2_9MOLU|nr:motility-associated protein Scm1 [Spiroplasma chinense]QEH61818.1 motility-associated protein Scm1 [Spiroplasma chinense]
MKHKIVWILTSVVGVIFTTLLITALCLAPTVNVDNELENLVKFNAGLANFTQQVNSNISNRFDFAYFIFGVEGLFTMMKIHSFNVVVFAVLWSYLLPLIGILLGSLLMVSICLIIVERIKREYKYKIMKACGKYGMYSSFGLLIVFSIATIVVISLLEKEFRVSNDLNGVLNLINVGTVHNGMTYLVTAKYLSTSTYGSLMVNGIASSGLDIAKNFNVALLTTTLSLLMVVLPILFIIVVTTTSIWISTFISNRGNGLSKFARWLGNIRIDSRREFYGAVFKNKWFIIATTMLLISAIFPGIVHGYERPGQIFLTVSTIIIVPLCFLPTLISWLMIINVKRFNYNKVMFLQILILAIAVFVIQINVWVLFREEMQMPISVMTALPFVTLTVTSVALFGFIKWQH